MNESTATFDERPKSSRPMRASVDRSRPTIAPTNAVMATSNANCEAFSRRPSWTEVREVRGASLTGPGMCVAQRARTAGRRPGSRRGPAHYQALPVTTRGGMRSANCGERPAAAVRGQDLGLLRGRRRNVLRQRLDELLLGRELERGVVTPLEANC